MAQFDYSLDLDAIQADILEQLDDLLAQQIIPNATLDSEDVPKFGQDSETPGQVKPFIIVWFRGLRRSGARRGTRSFSTPRLDAYNSGFDLICVANNADDARKVLNNAVNVLVGVKPLNSGYLYPDGSLWENSRAILDSQNKPSRWAATARFRFGVLQSRVEVP